VAGLLLGQKGENTEAINRLEKLILDWPMDFHLIVGDTREEREDKRVSGSRLLGRDFISFVTII
jgi:hypothetical protein